MVELRNLTTGYSERGSRKVTVSTGISCCLEKGELVSLLGKNGAGKSTLLKTLCGFMPPLGGEIMIDGTGIGDYSRSRLSKVVSVVLTERPQVVSMSVEDMVGMGRAPYTGFGGRLGDNDREIVDWALTLCGIREMAKRTVDTLSDGERQKVMIAKALSQTTPVILLDEPSAFLDYPSKVELMLFLRRLAREEGKLILQSTHDINVALRLSDRLMLVDRRLGMAYGAPEQLAADGKLEEYFDSSSIYLDGLEFKIRDNG